MNVVPLSHLHLSWVATLVPRSRLRRNENGRRKVGWPCASTSIVLTPFWALSSFCSPSGLFTIVGRTACDWRELEHDTMDREKV